MNFNFVTDRRTDGQTHIVTPWAPVGAKNIATLLPQRTVFTISVEFIKCVPEKGLLSNVIPLEKVTLIPPLGPRTYEELPAVVLVHLVDLPQQADVAVPALRVV